MGRRFCSTPDCLNEPAEHFTLCRPCLDRHTAEAVKPKWEGPEYLRPIEPNEASTRCRGCESLIVWRKTPAGKNSPVDLEGGSHWATCPNAGIFRKGKG